jgi:arylamine N-acetyltransferase
VYLETSNWFTSTHPRSPFVTGLLVNRQHDDGSRTTLSDWTGLSLTERTPAGASTTPLEWGAVPELLAERFALPGYAIGAHGRLIA